MHCFFTDEPDIETAIKSFQNLDDPFFPNVSIYNLSKCLKIQYSQIQTIIFSKIVIAIRIPVADHINHHQKNNNNPCGRRKGRL